MKRKTVKNEANGMSDTDKLRAQLTAMHMRYMEQNFEALGQKAALEKSPTSITWRN